VQPSGGEALAEAAASSRRAPGAIAQAIERDDAATVQAWLTGGGRVTDMCKGVEKQNSTVKYPALPKGTPAPASSVEARVFEERVDLSNNMTWRQMIGVGVRNVVLARGELDRLEGPGYAARRTELRRERRKKPREQGTGRRRRRRTRQKRTTRQRRK